jgi:hypothetical protein
MDIVGKKHLLIEIMRSTHALAAIAWPDGIPLAALDHIIDIQIKACKALGLPGDLPLLTGDETVGDL